MRIDFSVEQRRFGDVRKEEHLAVATAERHTEIDESQLRTMPNGNINDCRLS